MGYIACLLSIARKEHTVPSQERQEDPRSVFLAVLAAGEILNLFLHRQIADRLE